jgi:hypothetical protein
MPKSTLATLILFPTLFFPTAIGQDKAIAADTSLRLDSLMTAAEFRSCGLNKLSSEEMSRLNAWLQSFAVRVATSVSETKEPKTPDVIESEIAGDFNGWDGETIFKLINGQIWQQAEYDYEYEYAFQPEVTIYKAGGGYKMKVEGMDDTIYVRRIK